MSKESGRQRSRDLQKSSYSSGAQGFSKPRSPGIKSIVPFLILFFAIPAIGLFITNFFNAASSPPDTRMPKAVLEMVKPTAEDEIAMNNKEKKLLKKAAKLPTNSPELFGLYGNFAYECQGCGLYAKAQTYYDKAFVLGPIAYKSYEPQFAKTGDFELNYVSMLTDTGRLNDSAIFAGKLWAQQTKCLGPLNEHALQAGVTYARCLGDASQPAEQEKVSTKLVTLLEANGRGTSSDWVDSMICLGASHQAQNQMHDAKICYEKALAVAETNPDMSLDTSNLKENLKHFRSIK